MSWCVFRLEDADEVENAHGNQGEDQGMQGKEIDQQA